ncbi:hypothetical protein [Methylophilus sp. Leaf408]|jgi:hypothetical protein|uniref:hypothetical protein n=1 Tax=Methylophilus sp. Leaf408 TaxID=2876561 RepID=UPI001E5C0FFA|nr:hypothetical protein [Methylophilus sp. Leaf408]
MQKAKQKEQDTKVDLESDKISLELPDAAEEALINAGIAADPDTMEVSDTQFKQMRFMAGGR